MLKTILNRSQPYFKQQAAILGRMNGFVQENLTGFNVLKTFLDVKKTLKRDLKRFTDELQQVGFKASFISGLMMPALHIVSDFNLSDSRCPRRIAGYCRTLDNR